MRIVWTEPALRDMDFTRAYITRDNPIAADNQIVTIVAAVAGLVRFPETGRPGRRDSTRELIIGKTPYVVAYRLRGDVIEVLRVMHGRQRWPDGF